MMIIWSVDVRSRDLRLRPHKGATSSYLRRLAQKSRKRDIPVSISCMLQA